MNSPDSGYDGEFFWGPQAAYGSAINVGQTGAGPFGIAYGTPGFPSTTFGFQMACTNAVSCSAEGGIVVNQIVLTVGESVGPSLTAGGVWNQTTWVRGSWPISIDGDSPSGVCSLSAALDGQQVVTTSYPVDQTTWHQCDAAAAGGASGVVNTTQFPDGGDQLQVNDTDAAGLSHGATETVDVDNATPTVSLSGPSNASSTDGTQYVTESVQTGPSGAYGAECSVDGGPDTFYPGASGRVPVNGLGAHDVTCTGQNNAFSVDGARATSTPASFSMDIQQPTAEGITFAHIADTLKCRTTLRRIAIAGHRYVIHRDGRRIVVYSRTRHVTRRVHRCVAPTVKRTVLVPLRHDGKLVLHDGRIVRVRRTRRVVVLPHLVTLAHRRIRHGSTTTVSGYLELADGTALADTPVMVVGAPADGDRTFTPVSGAVTNADGIWTAVIPRGPSRVLEAVYGGDSINAATGSSTVHLSVPAKINFSISPRTLPWRRAITVSGRLRGGYIPRDGVALRFLVRYPHSSQRSTLLALRTDDRGRFHFTWSYHAGRGIARYPFSVATTATESDYPYAAASSRRIDVTFGRATPHRHTPGRRHR